MRFAASSKGPMLQLSLATTLGVRLPTRYLSSPRNHPRSVRSPMETTAPSACTDERQYLPYSLAEAQSYLCMTIIDVVWVPLDLGRWLAHPFDLFLRGHLRKICTIALPVIVLPSPTEADILSQAVRQPDRWDSHNSIKTVLPKIDSDEIGFAGQAGSVNGTESNVVR